MPKSKGFTPKQRKFICEFLKDQNGTQAAIRAGYGRKTANRAASYLMSNSVIHNAIEAKLREAERESTKEVAGILTKIANIAESDIRQLFNADGSMKSPREWPDSIALAVSAIETDELFEGSGIDREQVGFTKKVKLWDKTKALEMLGRYRKLFTDKVEHSFGEEVFERLERARANGKA